MRAEQKVVAVGAVSGAVLMAATVWIIAKALPQPLLTDALAERLAYALSANVIAIVPLVVMFVAVANSRFRSEAIDPTRHVESRAFEIDRRVATNTLEQSFVFVVVSLATSTILPLEHLQVVRACAIVFVVARTAFWLGYRINPLYRAAGMAATAFLNLAMILYVGFQLAASA